MKVSWWSINYKSLPVWLCSPLIFRANMDQGRRDGYSYENPYMHRNTEKVNVIRVRDPTGLHQYRNGIHMSFHPPDPSEPPYRPAHPAPHSRSRSRSSAQNFPSAADAPAVPSLPFNPGSQPYPTTIPQQRLGVTLPANGPFRPEYQPNYQRPDPVPRYSVSFVCPLFQSTCVSCIHLRLPNRTTNRMQRNRPVPVRNSSPSPNNLHSNGLLEA